MSKDEFYGEIAAILEVEKAQIREDAELAEFPEWNSLSVMTFIAFADEKLHSVISPKALADVKKIGDLCGLVRDKLTD